MSQRERLQLQIEESAMQRSKPASEAQAEHTPPVDSPAQSILRMQHTHGNQAVRRMLARVQRSSLMDGGPISSEISEEINSKRGSGGSLDSSVQAEMSSQMGRDFSDVSVHTDSQSDHLNKDLGAKAFTTGKDIFFSEGAYQPGSTDGNQLLAHELTHVVHQDGSNPSGDLTLGPANDSYEQEADQMASTVTSDAQAKRDPSIQRQEGLEEEEEMAQAKRDPAIQRQEGLEEEEEMAQAKRDPAIQRQEGLEEEEEMAQAKRDPAIQRHSDEEGCADC